VWRPSFPDTHHLLVLPRVLRFINHSCGTSTIVVADKKDQSRCVYTNSKEGLMPASKPPPHHPSQVE
jgi:hypothetical protein